MVSYKAVTTLSLTLSLLTSATSRIWQLHPHVQCTVVGSYSFLINET